MHEPKALGPATTTLEEKPHHLQNDAGHTNSLVSFIQDNFQLLYLNNYAQRKKKK